MIKKGVTILEVIIALVILVLVIGGLVNIFISSQRWLIHARARMQGGELGKRYLDPLQMEVSQAEWDAARDSGAAVSCLTGDGTTNCNTATWSDVSGITYTPVRRSQLPLLVTGYDVSAVGAVDPVNYPFGHLRRVTICLDWTGQEHDPLTP